MSYRLNDWWLTNPEYVTPKKDDEIGVVIEGDEKVERKYVEFNVTDLTVSPFTYIYRGASSKDKGNSVEIVADLSDEDSGSYLTMYIDDGNNRQGIKIYKNKVTLLDGTSITTDLETAGSFHRYTLSLMEDEFVFTLDKNVLLRQKENPVSTGESQVVVGFPESQTGSYKAKFEYIKYAEGVYTYVILEDVDFEFQLDSAPTFDTINLKTYNKDSFIHHEPTYDGETPEEEEQRKLKEAMFNELPAAWEGVEHICGTYRDGVYDNKGIVHSISIALPQKPDMSMPPFFYRVRIAGDKYTSDYSQTYISSLTKPKLFSTSSDAYYEQEYQLPVPLPGYIFIYDSTTGVVGNEIINYTQADDGVHRIYPTGEGAKVILPPIPVSDNWKITLCNIGEYTVLVKSEIGDEMLSVEPKQVVSYEFDTADNKWYSYVEQNIAKFNLRPDVSSEIFKAVYTTHIPSYDYVYTKEYNTGNIATIVNAEASEVAKMFTAQQNQAEMLNIFKAENNDFTERWKSIYNLSETLFKNRAEMRDAFQVLIGNSLEQMRKYNIEQVLTALTGSKPDIIEYKDKIFNILWSTADFREQPQSRRYQLADPDHPSYYVNPFIVYDGADKHYTWHVKVYDPYNMQYSQELIKQVLQLYKPGWTHVIIDFYDVEGAPIRKKYVYWYDSYLNATYNL